VCLRHPVTGPAARAIRPEEKAMNDEQKSSRRNHLTLTTEEGKIELVEAQLSRATGGLSLRNHLKI
jgi:hypothetical protein